MRRLLFVVFLGIGVVISFGASAAVWAEPLGDARLGVWMPQDLDGFDPSRHHQATIVSRAHADAFVYRGRVVGALGGGGPFDGPSTVVPAGSAYTRANVAYDYHHHRAFTLENCCTVHDKVLAFAEAPPHRVSDTDLHNVHTVRGFALGDRVAKVRRINGFARLLAVPKHGALRMLSYAAMYTGKNSACGQFQNFIFRDDRLVYLELLDGC